MRKIISVLAVVMFSHSSFALSELSCNVQMQGKSAKNKVAPILTGQGLNSILQARNQNNYLTLKFNSHTISHSKAHVILDGRTKRIPMNIHLSVEEKNNLLLIGLKDLVTQKNEKKEFEINSEITMFFENGNGIFQLECMAQL